MVTPELKWPTTNFTPSPTNLLATDTPSFGSARSSPVTTVIFLPRIPPAALMSSDGLFGAVLELRTESCAAAGDRTADADLDLGGRGAGE